MLRFVFHHPLLYVAYKPLIENDFHICHLYFRPLYLGLLFALPCLTLLNPATQALTKLVLGTCFLISYVFLLLYLKPLRRTRSWKLPVKILVVVIGVLALVLNYVSSLKNIYVDGSISNKNVETAILGLSFAVVILSGLLIGIIIPIAAVYELWSGAKREKKCSRMFKMLKARRNNLKLKRNVLNSAKSSVIEKLTDMVGSSIGDADPEEMFLLLQLLETEEHQTPMDSNNVESNNVESCVKRKLMS